jgi:pilus assembly protein Flp/PilA
MNMRAECKNFVRDERAATAIEYGLIAALIAVATISVLTHLARIIRLAQADVA